MYNIITIGSALRDFTFYIEQDKKFKERFICIPKGVKINISEAYFTYGGGACNVAVGLANFGLKVAVIARVGQDYSGRAIIEDLKKKRIETKFVQVDDKLHTGVSVIIQPKGGERTIFTYRGANDKLQITNYKLQKTKWIYLASLSGNWRRILNKIYLGSRIKNLEYKVVWNPGVLQLKTGKKKLEKFLKKTEVLILNRVESAILTRGDEKNVPHLLKLLYQLGPKIVVITCGNEGAYVMDKNGVLYEPARAVQVIDTTGAGDSFSSGFLAGLILFNDIKKALRLGIFNSAANLHKVGAQAGLLTKKDLRKIRL